MFLEQVGTGHLSRKSRNDFSHQSVQSYDEDKLNNQTAGDQAGTRPKDEGCEIISYEVSA